MSGAFARPAGAAAADGDIDVMILQTAVSLELLAVATYGAALDAAVHRGRQPGRQGVRRDDDEAARRAPRRLLGPDQGAGWHRPDDDEPEVHADRRGGQADAEDARPTSSKLAATLEEVATDTYLADLKLFTDVKSRVLMASVMGVECQHLATLRAVGALLGGAPELIAIPTDVAKLPAAAGSVAFPAAFEDANLASPPEEGAVK